MYSELFKTHLVFVSNKIHVRISSYSQFQENKNQFRFIFITSWPQNFKIVAHTKTESGSQDVKNN